MNRTNPRLQNKSTTQKQSHQAISYPNISSHQPKPPPTSFCINTASNTQLRQMIQSMILKSRSLIASLEATLKELEETKAEKEFWKGHYYAFKSACEKCIESRGIAPFEYISQLEKTVKEWNYRKEEEHYRNMELNNFKMESFTNSLFNSQMNSKFNQQQSHSHNQLSAANQLHQSEAEIKRHYDKTQPKTPSKKQPFDSIQKLNTTEIQNNESLLNNTFNKSITGIKLCGTNKKKKSLDQKQIKLQRTFKRKDSIQTKRIEVFSFANLKSADKKSKNHLELIHG